jgi:hypothetical protein
VDTVRLRFIADLAKFADLETMSMGYGGDGMGSDDGQGNAFRTITRPSKMNDDNDGDDQFAPF